MLPTELLLHAEAAKLGFLGAINILVEALISAKVIESAALADLLQRQIDRWRATEDPILREAANILIHVRQPLVSEEVAQQRALLSDEPKGQA
jgi:hypothetical protein